MARVKLESLKKIPFWIVATFALVVTSLISLVYFLIKNLRSNSRPYQKNADVFGSMEQNQADGKINFRQNGVENNLQSVMPLNAPEQEAKTNFKGLESLSILPSSDMEYTKKKNAILFIVGPLLALVIAYVAQAVFGTTMAEGGLQKWGWLLSLSVPGRLWLGAGIYLIAILIWVLTAPIARGLNKAAESPNPDNNQKIYHDVFRFVLILISIGFCFLSIVLYVNNGENGWVRSLWMAGLLSFVLSQVLWFKNDVKLEPGVEKSPPFQWHNWLILLLILGGAFWLRFYQLASIPDDFHGDMASYGLLARDILSGKQQEIFSDGYYGIPMMGFLPAAFAMAVFGNNIFGLQMASVIGGVLSLFAIYLFVWRLFNSHRLAALTIAVVAINVVHIHFSRIAAYMDPWSFGYFALFFLIDGLKARRSTSFGLAGIFLACSLQMYFSGRVLVFIIGFFLIYAFFFQRQWIVQNKRGFALMVLGVLITMGPALVFHLTHWDSFMSRSREVLIFTPGTMQHLLSKYNTSSEFFVFLTQVKLTLLMFNQSGDSSTQFGFPHPMFSSLVSPLIFLGVGAGIRRWKHSGMAFAFIWLGLMAVLGSVLTEDAPFWPRLVGIVPVAALFIAVAIDQVFEYWKNILGARTLIICTALVAIFLATVSYITWKQYYVSVEHNASATTLVGRYINALPADVTACSLLSGPPLIVRETYFLAWPHKLIDIPPDAPDSELDTCTGSSLVWVISPENIGRLDAIRARWPNGVKQTYQFQQSDYIMTFYRVNVDIHNSEKPDIVDTSPWVSSIKNNIIFVVIYTMLIWLFFRFLPPKLLHRQQIKRGIDQAQADGGLNTHEKDDSLKLPGNFITTRLEHFTKWYNEFNFPAFNRKSVISALLLLTAVGLAYFAQTFLDQQKGVGLHLPVEALYIASEGQRLMVACFIFLVAALIWTLMTADQGRPSFYADVLKNIKTTLLSLRDHKIVWKTLFNPLQIVSAVTVVSAMALYVALGENSVVRWLWIVSLGLFIAALFHKRQNDVMTAREESPTFYWYDTQVLIILLALALFLRVYRLYDIPLDLSTDMASVGIGAREYLLGVEQRLFGTGWYYMPRISFIPYVISMALMGNNLFGLYFATAVMGTLNILGIYLFVWRLFDHHRLAFLTALLVVTNPAHINFSRITSYVDPWFLGFFALFFFVDGLKGRRKVSLAIAGLFIGLTLVMYPSGRVIIPLIVLGLLYAWLYKHEWITDNYAGLFWMTLAVLVSLGPNLIYFITDWSVYMQRSREVIIFNEGVAEHLKHKYEVDSLWMVVWEQIKRSALMFNYYTDRSAQFSYPHPMFNSLISPLLILGFGMCLYRWKKLDFLFAISSFVSILLIGGIVTNDAPTWVRLVGIIPFAALMMALVLNEFVNIFVRASLKPFVPILIAMIVLFLGMVGYMDWKIYIDEVDDLARPVVRVGRYVDSLPDNVTACGITEGYPMNQEEINFLGWPHLIVVVPPDTDTLDSEICPGQNVAWILSPLYQDRLAELQAQWPGGNVEEHFVKDQVVFISYLSSTSKAIP